MMRTQLAALAFLSILCHLSVAFAAEMASKAELPASQPQPASRSQAQSKSASDCDGKPSPSGSVTALLSKLVHSSSEARGVQCPIPPVPEQTTIQESNP